MRQQQKVLIIKTNDGKKATDKKDEVGRALDDVQILVSKLTKAGKIVINLETDEARTRAEDKLQELGNMSVTHGKKLQPKLMLCNVGEEGKRETFIEHFIRRNDLMSTITEIGDKIKVVFENMIQRFED